MHHEPWYVWALILMGAVGLPGLAALMLDRQARAARAGRLAGLVVAVVATAWLVATSLMADAGLYHRPAGTVTPWFGIAVAGALAGALLLSAVPGSRRLLAAPGTPAGLTVPHTVRVVGLVFVIAAALGSLPWVFALPAGLGDFTVGLAAPGVARRLARRPDAPGAIRFHLLGIADLAVALALGFLCGLGPVHIIAIPPSTTPLSQLPLVLVPTVAVPTAIALHILAIGRIRAARHGIGTGTSTPNGPAPCRLVRLGAGEVAAGR